MTFSDVSLLNGFYRLEGAYHDNHLIN